MVASSPVIKIVTTRLDEPDMLSSLGFSLLFHLLLVGIISGILKIHMHRLRLKPETYQVSLVQMPIKPDAQGPGVAKITKDLPQATIEEMKQVQQKVQPPKAMDPPKMQEKKLPKEDPKKLKEEIARIKQDVKNQQDEENIEQAIAAIAREQAEVPPVGAEGKAIGKGTGDGSGISEEYALAQYREIVRQKILSAWALPKWSLESIPKNTVAIILVFIDKDGNVIRTHFEKSSSIPFFDQSAGRAIRKASPLPPPPEPIAEEALEEGLMMHFSPTKLAAE